MGGDIRDEYNQLLKKISDELDIAPSKYQQAVDRYEAVGRVLEKGDYEEATAEPSIYTQGSFRLGTVVRPLKEGQESDYDIDLVCELQIDKKGATSRSIKTMVGDRLKSHGMYQNMLEDEGRRCWTLKYSEADGVGFHLDVLPSLPEEVALKQNLLAAGVLSQLADQAIAITHKNGDNTYEWGPSNPGGYADWFYDRMRLAFHAVEYKQRKQLFESNSKIFASVDAVPDPLIKTPLQRAIQILKRHRDRRFAMHGWEKEKPISIIITTLSALLYQQESDVLTTLENIINGLVQYAGLLTTEFKLDESLASLKIISRRADGTWHIPNPVNPEENFADRWHEDGHRRAKAFFQWVTWAHQDLIELLSKHRNISSIGQKLEDTFGTDIVGRAAKGLFVLGAPAVVIPCDSKVPHVQIENPSKLWGNIGR